MEVERRTYDADLEGFDEFLMKYVDDNDEYSDKREIYDDNELKILKNLFQNLKVCMKNREWHAMNYIEIVNKFKDILIDVSEACSIEVDGLELISQSKHHEIYSGMIDFLVDCHLKSELKNFDHLEYDDDDDKDGAMIPLDDVESQAELALKVIDHYNKHKGAKLKLVRMIRANFIFSYLDYYYITFSAVDEYTGCIATYQAALAERGSTRIIGLYRDVDADKTLSILSIKGAEEQVNYKLNFRASLLAEYQLKAESSSCNSVSSDYIHAGAVKAINNNLFDGASSLAKNTCLVKDESTRCNSVSLDDIHAGAVKEMNYNLIDGAPSSPKNLIHV